MTEDEVAAIERIVGGVKEYVDQQIGPCIDHIALHEQRLDMIEQWIYNLHATPEYRDFVIAEAKRMNVKVTELLAKGGDDGTDDE